MLRRRQPAAMPGAAPAKAPKSPSHKPRTKRPAVVNNAATAARKLRRSKAKALRQADVAPRLLLPAPLQVPLLTYAGDAPPIGSGATIIHLPHIVTGPCAPQPADAIQQNQRASCGARSNVRPTAAVPTPVTPRSPAPVAASRRRMYAVDPRAVAKIGITGAIIGAVVLLARLTPIKPNATLKQASPPVQATIVRDTGERTGASLYAMESPKLAHHLNAAKWMRAKRDRRLAAQVRIIDAPARMRQSCGEQTWPYIADYCLSVAEDKMTSAHANSVTAPPTPAVAAVEAVDAAAPHAAMAPATIDVAPALMVDAGHAISNRDATDAMIEPASYRTAAVSDDAAKMETQKPEPAPLRHHQPHRDEPGRVYARQRQASPGAVRAAAPRYALQPRHQAPRYVAWARPRQWPVRRFAGGPAYGIRPYGSEPSAFYAPWY
jgi:hypothetical protein